MASDGGSREASGTEFSGWAPMTTPRVSPSGSRGHWGCSSAGIRDPGREWTDRFLTSVPWSDTIPCEGTITVAFGNEGTGGIPIELVRAGEVVKSATREGLTQPTLVTVGYAC